MFYYARLFDRLHLGNQLGCLLQLCPSFLATSSLLQYNTLEFYKTIVFSVPVVTLLNGLYYLLARCK